MRFAISLAFLVACSSYAAPKGTDLAWKIFEMKFPMDGSVTIDARDGEHIEKQVSEETLALIRAGDEAIRKTREHFPFGMENVRYDIEKSKGRSLEIGIYRARCHYPSRVIFPENDEHLEIDAKAAIARACKGSRCGDAAYDAAAILNNLVPAGTQINAVHLKNFDHGFVVIGDPQAGNLRDDQLVVVDPWPPKTQALLVEDYAFGDASDFVVSYSYKADGIGAQNDRADSLAQVVVNRFEEIAIERPAPAFPPGTEVKTMVFEGTHATVQKRVIKYIAK